MTTRAIAVAALPVALLVLGATATAQFRSRTDLIELGAVVLDRNGDSVPDLEPSDFEILEDGHAVPIATFAAINADHPATPDDGRFLALLIEPRSPTATKLARELVERMGERDVVAILGLNGSKATTTDDRNVALKQLADLARPVAAVHAFPRSTIGAMPSDACTECGTGGWSSGWLGYDGPMNHSEIGSMSVPAFGNRNGYAFNALEQIERLADQLKQATHRRKSIVYVGPGQKLNPTRSDISGGETGRWFDAVKHASRADVSVSVISIDGLTGKSYVGARMLANETGGDVIVDTNVYDQSIERLWQHAGQYYLLGYAPPTKKGKAHAIQVRVKRPGVEVRALKARG